MLGELSVTFKWAPSELAVSSNSSSGYIPESFFFAKLHSLPLHEHSRNVWKICVLWKSICTRCCLTSQKGFWNQCSIKCSAMNVYISGNCSHLPKLAWILISFNDADQTALDRSSPWSDPWTAKIQDHPPKIGLGPVHQARNAPGPPRLLPVKNSISQRCHGEIMIYSQLPHMITSLQHHFEAAHLTNHDINWRCPTCEFPASSLWVSWDVADSSNNTNNKQSS